MSAVTPVDSGLAVTAHFRASASGTPRVISCKVARCEQNEEEMAHAFPYRLALVFDIPLTSLEEDVKNGT